MLRRQANRDQHLALFLLASASLLTVAARPAMADEPASLGAVRNWVTALAYSPDGNTLATVGGQTLLYRPGEVRLWDLSTGKEKAKLDGHQSTVWSVAFSPDGKTLASGDEDGIVKFWDVAVGKEKGALTAPGRVYCVAFSADGKKLASGGSSGGFLVWGGESALQTPPSERRKLEPKPLNLWNVPK